jgi:hypothetical protein
MIKSESQCRHEILCISRSSYIMAFSIAFVDLLFQEQVISFTDEVCDECIIEFGVIL